MQKIKRSGKIGPMQGRNEKMRDELAEYLYGRKMCLWRDRVARGLIGDFENRRKFDFRLKDGRSLEILEYGFAFNNFKDDGKEKVFLLAMSEDKVLGFMSIYVSRSSREGEWEADTNVAVVEQGAGVGGRLEIVKQYILQDIANRFDMPIVNRITDQNSWLMDECGNIAYDEYKKTGDLDAYIDKLRLLIMSRQYWWVLYGNGERGGYSWEDTDLIKRYYPEMQQPKIHGCRIQENDVNFDDIKSAL